VVQVFDVPKTAIELGQVFEAAGYELALVGGSVRDIILRRPSQDLDFTTNARPEKVKSLLSGYLDDLWDIGKDFGTIGGNKYVDGKPLQVEVTTYRTDEYDPSSRKPLVKYGDTLRGDLSRRDFTVNAIALRLPNISLEDPFGGVADIGRSLLRTPIEPAKSFDDDPLRMMRAVRFLAQLGFRIEAETAAAILEMHERISIVSKERIRDEFTKLILSPRPSIGVDALVDSGLIDYIVPELPALKMQIDPSHHHKDVYAHTLKVLENSLRYENDYLGGPDLTIRFACLLHDIAKPQTRRFDSRGKVSFRMHDVIGAKIALRVLKTLRFDKETTRNVAKLVELHMRFYGYGDAKWTDSAVRRYAHDAGDLLKRLHVLTRSDVTTQNSRKASRLAHAYDDIEQRINEIEEQEELGKIRPDLNGHEIMEVLGVGEGKEGWKIGKSYDYLLNHRIENGPVSKEEATKMLLDFAKREFKND
jgi:poly(A) polymerase